MKNELFQKVADKYMKKFQEMKEKYRPKSESWNDVAPNLITGLIGSLFGLRNPDRNKRNCFRSNFINCMKALKTYFNLLEKYPEFKKAEFESKEGAYPDIFNYVYEVEGINLIHNKQSTHERYVNLVKARLESKLEEAVK